SAGVPTRRPSRERSRARICSVRTSVRCPPTSTSGRNTVGSALVDVGATTTVESSLRKSVWTMTAYRRPCCSCPRARGAGPSAWTSPLLTQRFHERLDRSDFASIVLVCGDAGGVYRREPVQTPTAGIDDGFSDRLGAALPVAHQQLESTRRFFVEPKRDRSFRHEEQ